MAKAEDDEVSNRNEWRELSRDLTSREILYIISGSPDGVREPKIKDFMKDVFTYSFQGSVESHLQKLEADGFVTKEVPKRGAPVWHANPFRVREILKREIAALKSREKALYIHYRYRYWIDTKRIEKNI